jgi:CRISPR-associated protein Cmr5
MALRTQEQQRAALAWAQILEVSLEPEVAKKYNSYVKSATSLILTNGLGQTLAFYSSKSGNDKPEKRAYAALLRHLTARIGQTMRVPGNDLLEAITNNYSSAEYRRVTNEALAYLLWLKRFADAKLPEEAT